MSDEVAMIPVGYMAKVVVQQPDWLNSDRVAEICSVSGCISEDFADYIQYWRHNGYWLFDAPETIAALAAEFHLDLSQTRWFYYEVYPLQFDSSEVMWESFSPEVSLPTNVRIPERKILLGYDIVSFGFGTAPECSYLSCNHMADRFDVNRHCLFDTFEAAKQPIDRNEFIDCEPGPCRIFAVYEVPAVPSVDI